jgi:hypothetical protein
MTNLEFGPLEDFAEIYAPTCLEDSDRGLTEFPTRPQLLLTPQCLK